MSQTTLERGPMNGVDVPTLFATINAVAGAPELAEGHFRATTEWQSGTHSRTTIRSFFAAGGEHEHKRVMTVDADHPAVLVGEDNGPLPIELVLAGLASCLTSGIGNIASARGVHLTAVTSTIEGDIDLRGILGLSDEVRNGFSNIRVDFEVEGDASEEKLAEIVAQSRRRSAVYDIVTNGVPVEITVNGR
jgi:uncharacterized OsmC-like protein